MSKRTNRHLNHDKPSTNNKNESVHDEITLFVSSKFWILNTSSSNFKYIRVSDNSWKVCRKSTISHTYSGKQIPKFNYICTVIVTNNQLHLSYWLTKALKLHGRHLGIDGQTVWKGINSHYSKKQTRLKMLKNANLL